MVTKERFAQGMTFQQYLDQMGTNKEKFVQFLGEIKIKPEDRAALDRLGSKLKILVPRRTGAATPSTTSRCSPGWSRGTRISSCVSSCATKTPTSRTST